VVLPTETLPTSSATGSVVVLPTETLSTSSATSAISTIVLPSETLPTSSSVTSTSASASASFTGAAVVKRANGALVAGLAMVLAIV